MTAFIAQVVTAGSDPMSLLLAYGPLGLFTLLLIAYMRTSMAREHEKSDQAEQQVRELNQFIRDELLPKQVEATILHKQVAEVLERAVVIISEANRGSYDQRRGRRE